MNSLSSVLAAHSPLLVLDAASARVQVGWLDAATPAHWGTREEEAGQGIFRVIERLGVDVAQAGAFLYCEGPGSILGLRTAAMAIRTWATLRPRPIFAYRSLDLVAAALDRPGLEVVADARRDTWHLAELSPDHQPLPLRRVPTAAVSHDCVTPEHFRAWSTLPTPLPTVPYDVPAYLAATTERLLLRATTEPDAFLHEATEYVTWTPHIHRAPS